MGAILELVARRVELPELADALGRADDVQKQDRRQDPVALGLLYVRAGDELFDRYQQVGLRDGPVVGAVPLEELRSGDVVGEVPPLAGADVDVAGVLDDERLPG